MSDPDDDEPVVGYTGARFGGPRRRKGRPGAGPAPVVPEVASGPLDGGVDVPSAGPVVGRTGARFGRAAPAEAADPVAVPEPAPVPQPPPVEQARPEESAEDGPEYDGPEGDGIRVRPYVLTGGRTRATRTLPIEALVSTSAMLSPPAATVEQRQVMMLCRQPRSVAEIAALVHVPLGVAQVLVGDLADAGAVSVHAAVPTDVDLMRRVLAGLRRL